MLFLLCRSVELGVICVKILPKDKFFSGVCVCLGAGEPLGLVSKDLAVMRWAMKILWYVTMWCGLLGALALRRRFRVAFLLRVWITFSGVLLSLVPFWIVIRWWYFGVFVVWGSRSLFEFAERLLQ